MVSTCGCSTSQVSGSFGVFTCKRNIQFAFNAFKYIFAASTAGIAWFYTNLYDYFTGQNLEKTSFKPFALSINQINLKIETIIATEKTVGSSGNNVIFSDKNGSKIFAGPGLNYIVAGNGADLFHFSLCSAKIIDNKVSVIDGFNANQDKISYTCSKNIIHKENITILHEKFSEQDITYIHVVENEKSSAIALLGDVPITPDDILLNNVWDNI